VRVAHASARRPLVVGGGRASGTAARAAAEPALGSDEHDEHVSKKRRHGVMGAGTTEITGSGKHHHLCFLPFPEHELDKFPSMLFLEQLLNT
jgi:hypothetical protein